MQGQYRAAADRIDNDIRFECRDFAGRTFEYFSEDGYLFGVMASQQVAGAQAKGVYAFMKHFALNDQETNRLSELATWANEQSIREIYLKPFEMSVKQGGAGAVMSAFNYIGMEWGGSHSGLLNTVLRGEWGFRGMVLTIMKYLKRRKLAAAASAPADAPVKA